MLPFRRINVMAGGYDFGIIAYNWKSHATLTPLAKQDCPLWLQYD